MTNVNRPGPAFSPNSLNDKLNMIQLCEKSFVGVPQLLIDFQRLSEDQETADTVFIVDRDEERIYAHKIILQARYVFNHFRFIMMFQSIQTPILQMQKFSNIETRRILMHCRWFGNTNIVRSTHSFATCQCSSFSTIYSVYLYRKGK